MKHLLSLATLAATAALPLGLTGTALAASHTITTIPNPSGHLTCTGTNSDGSDAAWTVGGAINFNSDYSNPNADLEDPNGNVIGYHNIKPASSGNPYDGSGGASCTCEVDTLSNVQSGCAVITGDVNIYFTYSPYATGWLPSSPQHVYHYSIPSPAANTIYTPNNPLNFKELDNVNQVQYKVTSIQNGHTLGEVATTNL